MEFLGGFSFGRLISASSSNGIHDDFKNLILAGLQDAHVMAPHIGAILLDIPEHFYRFIDIKKQSKLLNDQLFSIFGLGI